MPSAAPIEIRAEAIEMRRKGRSCCAIADALGVSPQVIARWSKRAGLPSRIGRMEKAEKKEKISRLLLAASDPDYGPECPKCGGQKYATAAMCSDCRLKERRGEATRAKQYSADDLIEAWPMPIPFPPVVAGVPLVHMYDRSEPEREHA